MQRPKFQSAKDLMITSSSQHKTKDAIFKQPMNLEPMKSQAYSKPNVSMVNRKEFESKFEKTT